MLFHSIALYLFDKIPKSGILYHKCIGNQQCGERPNRGLWMIPKL